MIVYSNNLENILKDKPNLKKELLKEGYLKSISRNPAEAFVQGAECQAKRLNTFYCNDNDGLIYYVIGMTEDVAIDWIYTFLNSKSS